MKKNNHPNEKLSLKTETLRRLDDATLTEVAAGGTVTVTLLTTLLRTCKGKEKQ